MTDQTRIRKSRELLQNPYAYLDGDGKFSTIDPTSGPERRTPRRTNREIEEAARDLQILLWKHRESIWPGRSTFRPDDVLDPMEALNWLGYDCDYDESLGKFKVKGKSIEVAGVMDRSTKRVRISREFPVDIRNFTAAHELGHVRLAHEGIGLHRDRPQDGSGKDRARPVQEIEADKFASYFLMPGRLLKAAFIRSFETECFALTEATMFALAGNDHMDLETKCKNRRDLSRVLAGAERYNGVHFLSLAKRFKVSDEAMAIRLEELDLVDDYE